jgi:hypothetical protein
VYSTSLDDRLGVHVILDVLPLLGIRPDILLTDDEEIGCSTAQEFFTDKQYNWMFQFDRRGTDAVCYEFYNMEPYVEECFKLGFGSFSDICWLEHLGCGGVNVGTGYYNEHTKNSYANLKHCSAQVERFATFWYAFKDEHIPHEPMPKWTYKADLTKADLGFYTDDEEEYFHYSPSPPYGTMKRGNVRGLDRGPLTNKGRE